MGGWGWPVIGVCDFGPLWLFRACAQRCGGPGCRGGVKLCPERASLGLGRAYRRLLIASRPFAPFARDVLGCDGRIGIGNEKKNWGNVPNV